MISGLPLPATTGNASLAPAASSRRSSGSGLISVRIGEKPDTITPGWIGSGNARAAIASAARLPLGGRQRVAPREHRPDAVRSLALIDREARSVINGPKSTAPTEEKCGAAKAVGA